MKNLENYGVLEMNAMEIKEVDGGFVEYLLALAVALTAMGIHDSIDHPDAYIKGFLGQEL